MRRLVLALFALFTLVAIAPAVSAQTMNKVRVMHASPDAPEVDIYVANNRVLANVPFFTTSGYLSLPDGTYRVDIVPAGESVSDAVWSGDLTVQGGYTGTVAAVNTLDSFEVVLYDDALTPIAGKSRVRVIHAVPDAVAVDIKPAGTGTVLVGNAPFKASATLEVDPGTYSFDISPAGSADVAFTTPSLVFLPGWSYTLVATGLIEDGNFWVQSRVDNYIMENGMAAMSSKGTGKLKAIK